MAMNGSVKATIGADIGDYQRAMNKVSELTTKAFNDAKKASETGANGMTRAVKAALGALNSIIPTSLAGVGRSMVDMFNTAGGQVQRILASIGEKIPEPFRRGFQSIQSIASSSLSGLSGVFSSAFSSINRVMNTSFVSGLRGMVTSVSSTVNDIANRFNPLVSKVANVANGMTRAFANGMTGMARSATGALNNISSKFASVNKGTSSLVSGFKQLAGAIGLVAIASKAIGVLTSSIDGAISRYDALNQFPKVMQMWGYSVDETTKSTKKMVDGIEGLPTTLDDITSTVQRLTTITGDLDKSTDSAIALNNAFLASGSSTADAARGTEQYMQMLATGKVDMMSWRTLQETMPGALMKTAEAFGYTGQSANTDFYEALKSGEITFDQFQDKLIELNDGVDGFAEQAKTATMGIRTSFTNMKQAVVRSVEGIIRAIDKTLESKGLPNLAKMLDDSKDKIISLGKAVESVVPAMVDGFTKLSGIDIVSQIGRAHV